MHKCERVRGVSNPSSPFSSVLRRVVSSYRLLRFWVDKREYKSLVYCRGIQGGVEARFYA